MRILGGAAGVLCAATRAIRTTTGAGIARNVPVVDQLEKISIGGKDVSAQSAAQLGATAGFGTRMSTTSAQGVEQLGRRKGFLRPVMRSVKLDARL